MTDIRIKFNELKIKIKTNRNPGLFSDSYSTNELSFYTINKFMKCRAVNRKSLKEFYRMECTYLTEEDFDELFFKSKDRKTVADTYGGIYEAVKFKLICELNL
ncbi:MAG TPA: hypothetical protein PK536_12195 [Ignavibacteria bacterium]|nr:hypothetical protein [Bacteroidota bacterium]HRI86196.1 hypothetical protein [Ignavibacteria bacterium]HRK00472.1 hypothetical protein [Ignavibacteria bacterium]